MLIFAHTHICLPCFLYAPIHIFLFFCLHMHTLKLLFTCLTSHWQLIMQLYLFSLFSCYLSLSQLHTNIFYPSTFSQSHILSNLLIIYLIISSTVPSGHTTKHQTYSYIWPCHVDICSVCSVSSDAVMIYCCTYQAQTHTCFTEHMMWTC